jgi:hypothetical protein
MRLKNAANRAPVRHTVGAPQLQRAGLCVGVAVLMYWTAAGSLFLHAPGAQCALVVGAAAGLIGGVWTASGSAAFAMLLGLVTGPSSVWLPGQVTFAPVQLVWVLLAAGVAAGLAWTVSNRRTDPRWILVAVVGFMVVNAWWTTIEIDSTPLFDVRTNTSIPPLSKVIDADVTGKMRNSDEYLYAWVRQKMRSGTDYYTAFAGARRSIVAGSTGPTSVLNIREPLLYWYFAVASPWLIILSLLSIGTVAALSPILLLRDVVKRPVVLPAVAAILSLTIPLVTTSTVLFAEAWSGMLCLLAATAIAVAQRSARWRLFSALAVALTLLAFLVREFAVFALFAGLASAWFGLPERRRFGLTAWGAALGVGGVAYAAHFVAALPHLAHPAAGASGEGFGLFRGGLSYALSAFTFDSHVFAFPFRVGNTVPYVLALLGVVGAFYLRERATKVFVLGMLASLVSVNFLGGNGAQAAGTTDVVNYWGLMMLFTLYACMPGAFALVPVARSRADARPSDQQRSGPR